MFHLSRETPVPKLVHEDIYELFSEVEFEGYLRELRQDYGPFQYLPPKWYMIIVELNNPIGIQDYLFATHGEDREGDTVQKHVGRGSYHYFLCR